MQKPIILTPGPVKVPDYVLDAMRRPVIHQRGPDFETFWNELQDGLKYFFQTTNPVIAMPGSGTHGVESAIRSLMKEGEEILIPVSGKFSQRWDVFSKQIGLNVHRIDILPGEAPTSTQILKCLTDHPQIKALVLTHCETSTGALCDAEEIIFHARKLRPGLLLILDAISTAGIIPVYSDAWSADVVIAASQKSLLSPAGIVFLTVSPLAKKRLDPGVLEDSAHLSSYYYSLAANSYPFTPPTQILFGVNAALKNIRQKSLPVIWNETRRMARLFRHGILSLGGSILPKPASDSLTAFSFPEMDLQQIYLTLREQFGIEIAEGQGPLKGKILRVAHFGDVGINEMKVCVDALRKILEEAG